MFRLFHKAIIIHKQKDIREIRYCSIKIIVSKKEVDVSILQKLV